MQKIPSIVGDSLCCALQRTLESLVIVAACAAPIGAAAQTIPAHPVFGRVTLANGAAAGTGPWTMPFAVSNITLTNYDTAPQTVSIFAPVYAAANSACYSKVTGGFDPRVTVVVQPKQTLVIPYPTPLVFVSHCIAAELETALHGGSVEVEVTGYQ